jgi:hypothetical protein
LRDLGASLAEATSAEDACSIAASILADNSADVPFALFYLVLEHADQTAWGEQANVAPVENWRGDTDYLIPRAWET